MNSFTLSGSIVSYGHYKDIGDYIELRVDDKIITIHLTNEELLGELEKVYDMSTMGLVVTGHLEDSGRDLFVKAVADKLMVTNRVLKEQ